MRGVATSITRSSKLPCTGAPTDRGARRHRCRSQAPTPSRHLLARGSRERRTTGDGSHRAASSVLVPCRDCATTHPNARPRPAERTLAPRCARDTSGLALCHDPVRPANSSSGRRRRGARSTAAGSTRSWQRGAARAASRRSPRPRTPAPRRAVAASTMASSCIAVATSAARWCSSRPPTSLSRRMEARMAPVVGNNPADCYALGGNDHAVHAATGASRCGGGRAAVRWLAAWRTLRENRCTETGRCHVRALERRHSVRTTAHQASGSQPPRSPTHTGLPTDSRGRLHRAENAGQRRSRDGERGTAARGSWRGLVGVEAVDYDASAGCGVNGGFGARGAPGSGAWPAGRGGWGSALCRWIVSCAAARQRTFLVLAVKVAGGARSNGNARQEGSSLGDLRPLAELAS